MGLTADRTLSVLDLVAASEEPVTLTWITGLTGLDKSVASRILKSLVQSGFLMRDPGTRAYAIGPRFVALSVAAVRRFGLAGLAHDALLHLRDRTGETVSVHLRVGDARICIDGAESLHRVRRALSLGESVPLYAGPTGKAILAFLPEDAQARAMAAADAEGRDLAHIRGQMAGLRRRHYIIVTSDRTPGVGAVSTPLFDPSGVVASLTVAGPEDRWTVPKMERYASEVVRVATDISRALGGVHPSAVPAAGGTAEAMHP